MLVAGIVFVVILLVLSLCYGFVCVSMCVWLGCPPSLEGSVEFVGGGKHSFIPHVVRQHTGAHGTYHSTHTAHLHSHSARTQSRHLFTSLLCRPLHSPTQPHTHTATGTPIDTHTHIAPPHTPSATRSLSGSASHLSLHLVLHSPTLIHTHTAHTAI